MISRSTMIALAAGAVVFGGGAPCQARPDAVVISYADLNLASPAGRVTLDRRIAGAAREVCGDFTPNDLHLGALARACRAELIDAAHGQVVMIAQSPRLASAANGASQAAF